MTPSAVRAAARAAARAATLGLMLASPLGAALAAQSAPAPKTDAMPVNARCPVMTDEDALPGHALVWQGRLIGFCCEKRIRKFQEHPERYRANLPELAAPGPAAGDGETGAGAAGAGEDDPGGLEALAGRLHPLVVHFPIALLLAAALAEALGALRGRPGSSPAARYCVALGALGALAAAFTGWQRAEGFAALPGTESHVDIHRWLAIAATSCALPLAVLGWWSRERAPGARAGGLAAFRLGLLLCAVLVSVAAHFGGTLVYGPGFPWSG